LGYAAKYLIACTNTSRYPSSMVSASAQALNSAAARSGSAAMAVNTPQLIPTTVAILEDEAHVRRMLEKVVSAHPGLQLAFSAQTVKQAQELALTHAAQVYLVDLGLPDADGREFIRWVSDNQPGAASMVVTVFGDDEHIVSSFAAGAVGYLLKDAPIAEIAQRISELVAGGSPISPSVARRMLQHFVTNANPNSAPAPLMGSISQPAPLMPISQPDSKDAHLLSEREHEVLRLIEKGLSYDEIAQVLGITWHTVTGYLRRVYRKLEVRSRSEAVFEARHRGLL
jgi:DNA-binding NarL/FixJ family response regulator